MFKVLFFLFFPCLLFADEFSIYNHKFTIENLKIENMENDYSNVQIDHFDNEIIKNKNLDYYILSKLYNEVLKQDIYKACDINCNIDIFEKAFNDGKYDLSSLAFSLFLNNPNNGERFIVKEEEFLLEKKVEEKESFYKMLFSIGIPESGRNNKIFSKYFVFLSMKNSDWVLDNLLDYIIKNKDSIVKEFEKLILKENIHENLLTNIENILNVEEKVLGFSNKQYQKVLSNFSLFKDIFLEIESSNDFEKLNNIPFKQYQKGIFYKFLQEVYTEKIYLVVDSEISNKNFKNALAAILLVPENMVSEKTYDKLSFIVEHADISKGILSVESIEKLLKITKENSWIIAKYIEFEKKRIDYLLERNLKKEINEEISFLLKLNSKGSYLNDKIKLKIGIFYFYNGDKETSDFILSNIENKLAYFSSFDGIMFFCKRFLWVFFAFLTGLVFVCLLSYKMKNFQNDGKKNKQRNNSKIELGNDFQIEDYEKNLKFFDLSLHNVTLNGIKTNYRKKIKKIHPDIIGRESKEFLEVQRKYKEILEQFKTFK